MFTTIENFYLASKPFVTLFDAFALKHSLLGRAKPDHICYKCESKESFEETRKLLENESEYMYQSFISGRKIAVIKLKRPIETSLGPISFVELSDQKPDQSQKEGFDHIESYAVERSYEDMVKEFEKSEKVILVKRPHHTTHDIDIGDDFLFRCTEGPLVAKIKRMEML